MLSSGVSVLIFTKSKKLVAKINFFKTIRHNIFAPGLTITIKSDMRHFIPHLQITATHGQIIATHCQVISAHIQTIPPLLLLITTHMQTVNRHKQIIPVHKKASAPLLQLTDTHGVVDSNLERSPGEALLNTLY